MQIGRRGIESHLHDEWTAEGESCAQIVQPDDVHAPLHESETPARRRKRTRKALYRDRHSWQWAADSGQLGAVSRILSGNAGHFATCGAPHAGAGALASPPASPRTDTSSERHALQVVRTELPVTGLPAGLEGLRIGFVTDLHLSESVPADDIERASC
jgi:hypothetical protein